MISPKEYTSNAPTAYWELNFKIYKTGLSFVEYWQFNDTRTLAQPYKYFFIITYTSTYCYMLKYYNTVQCT